MSNTHSNRLIYLDKLHLTSYVLDLCPNLRISIFEFNFDRSLLRNKLSIV